jgi:hypothetical protein
MADLTRFRGIGVARATDRRPLPAVLRAYRVAAVEINELIIELVGDTLELQDVVALNRTLLRSADELSLEYAPVEAFDAGPVLGRADAMLAGLLRGEPAVDPAQLAVAALGGVAEPGNAHLLEGLHAYLRHGSSNEAAVALGLHAQTMRHRLRRITELTGRDVRRSWDRLLLDVARNAHRAGLGPGT